MNQRVRLLVLFGFCLLGLIVSGTFGCTTLSPDGKLIWSQPKGRPDWLHHEPKAAEDRYLFVGLSGRFATEKEARDDALRAAISNVVRYVSVDVKSSFERLITSSGSSSEIIDPTVAVRHFEQQLSSAVARCRMAGAGTAGPMPRSTWSSPTAPSDTSAAATTW